jgi:16S rRNA (adenine1518-N6/adenine1519-N6)-dimethyltransferase
VSLKALRVDPGELLAEAAVPPTARAEEIDIAGFCRLARSYARLSTGRSDQAVARN